MTDLVKRGSTTAKQGFANEKDVASAFINWKKDKNAKSWLVIMGYDIEKIEWVKAEIISGHKADIVIEIKIKLKNVSTSENIQVKLVSGASFNQVDKRWVDSYAEMWNMPNNIQNILKRFTGEIQPNITNLKDKRRMFIYEFSQKEQKELLTWLNENKVLIVSDILKGRGQFASEWFLVINKYDENKPDWILQPINKILNHFCNGSVEFTKRGSININGITVQRKGGDNGRNTANMLQFKINPLSLMDIENQ